MVSQALVLDVEKGELLKAPARIGKMGISEAKAFAALKSHSEAERRRRERINAHLATLRGLVPCTEKQMDKATLLAAVISQVKEHKKNALEACKGLLVPMDDDQVKVETYFDGTLHFKASICCDYRPELLSDLRNAIDALPLKMVSAEISTLGSRLKNEFVLTDRRNKNALDDAGAIQLLTNSIHQTLTSVLEKGSASQEYSPRTTLPNKRRRVTFFDSSSSSS
ncbi:PREDICTED: transcription factor bHLH30-like isoform X1 [Populus euphratica]|uniref:Transcription factor bHLH30-like isoform X1 n=1 Tax=Populus euphratica TaxID=75702 RepID=A0AAJ6Y885_POPEU|nr:PREDICTED: transcription factor bHLH30-like isoform X1 [Populus euphratica]